MGPSAFQVAGLFLYNKSREERNYSEEYKGSLV